MKRYLVYKPFTKHFGLNKEKTYPVGTVFININDRICYENRLMCYRDSAKANECLVGDDDGCGMERGKLLDEIALLILGEKDKEMRYSKIMRLWKDPVAMKYSRMSDPDTEPFLWTAEIRTAPLDDLKSIIQLLENAERGEFD